MQSKKRINFQTSSLQDLLAGNDLRSIGKSNAVVKLITDQQKFDLLLSLLENKDRIIAMRAADSVEKITRTAPEYLQKHKSKLLPLAGKVSANEVKWHIAQLLPRLRLSGPEFDHTWEVLKSWALGRTNSRIVRVNALQGLFELFLQNSKFRSEFFDLLTTLKKDNVSSLNARIRKIEKVLSNNGDDLGF